MTIQGPRFLLINHLLILSFSSESWIYSIVFEDVSQSIVVTKREQSKQNKDSTFSLILSHSI